MKEFARDERGNVLMMFALAAVPLLGLLAGAIDLATAGSKRTSLQAALDSAALTVAREPPLTDSGKLKARLERQIGAQLAANGIGAGDWDLVSASDENGRLAMAATARIKTPFANVFGRTAISVRTTSEVLRGNNKLEVALVMDNTGSMGNGTGRIEALRAAASQLVKDLYAAPESADKVKVSLVPFVTGVNINVPGVFDMAWMDVGARARHHGANFNLVAGKRISHFKLFDALAGTGSVKRVKWKGCVEARAEPYDTEDAPPDPNVADTLHVPWFWPDEPDGGIDYSDSSKYDEASSDERNRYTNNYIPDAFQNRTKTTAPAQQRSTTKYVAQSKAFDEIPTKTAGPNKSCPEPLTPLTNDKLAMETRIQAMMPWDNSGTNVAQGMVWGWSVLSPTAPFTEGAPYAADQDPKDKVQKAMVVLTDGENQVWGGHETHNKSDYTAYGYLAARRLGTDLRDAAVTRVDEKVTELCGKIKAKQIRLYTITFQLAADSPARELFRRCASTPQMYFNSPSTTELKSIFQRIATDLNDLRVSR